MRNINLLTLNLDGFILNGCHFKYIADISNSDG